MISPELAKTVERVARRLGSSTLVITHRLLRLGATLAEASGTTPEKVGEGVARLAFEQLASLLAEGPSEQARAMLPESDVHPHEHQQLGGHGEPGQAEPPADDKD